MKSSFARLRGWLNQPVIQKLELIMSAISQFAAKQTAFNTSLSTSLDGIGADIKTLNDKIAELQNSAGAVTAEDQALLDELTAQGQALSEKFAAVDELTPPQVPTV